MGGVITAGAAAYKNSAAKEIVVDIDAKREEMKKLEETISKCEEELESQAGENIPTFNTSQLLYSLNLGSLMIWAPALFSGGDINDFDSEAVALLNRNRFAGEIVIKIEYQN